MVSVKKLDGKIQLTTSSSNIYPNNETIMIINSGTYIYNNENGVPIQIWLIMEYCGGRSVAQLAKTTVYNGGLLSENVIKYILRETLVALKYLHKNKVIHRDIKGKDFHKDCIFKNNLYRLFHIFSPTIMYLS